MPVSVKRAWLITSLILFVVLLFLVSTQLTLFVIQPLGAIPDGVTLVIWRGEKQQFIDSADAFCDREMGGVTLFCRLGALAGVAQPGRIILRLPYADTLYLWSTNGARYEFKDTIPERRP